MKVYILILALLFLISCSEPTLEELAEDCEGDVICINEIAVYARDTFFCSYIENSAEEIFCRHGVALVTRDPEDCADDNCLLAIGRTYGRGCDLIEDEDMRARC